MTSSPSVNLPPAKWVKQTPLRVGLSLYAVSTLVSMAIMSVGAGIACIALLISFGGFSPLFAEIKKQLRMPSTRLFFIASLGLTATCFLSLLVAHWAPLGYGGKFIEVSFLKDMAKVWYLFWPIPLVVGLRNLTQEGQKFVVKSWLLAFGVLSIVGIINYFTGWPKRQPIWNVDEARHHAVIFIGFHLSVASIYIFPFFSALDFSVRPLKRNLGFSRVLHLLLVIVGLLVLFMTYSRAVWVALPIGIFFWGLFRLPKKWALLILVGLLLGGAMVSQHPSIQARLQDSGSEISRRELWRANFEFFEQRPWTGSGWHHNLELVGYWFHASRPVGQGFVGGHAHNNVIEMIGSTGILGTLAWFFWCGVVFVLAKRAIRNADGFNFSKSLAPAWITFHINGLTQVNFWDSKVLHQMMFVIAWSLLWSR